MDIHISSNISAVLYIGGVDDIIIFSVLFDLLVTKTLWLY